MHVATRICKGYFFQGFAGFCSSFAGSRNWDFGFGSIFRSGYVNPWSEEYSLNYSRSTSNRSSKEMREFRPLGEGFQDFKT